MTYLRIISLLISEYIDWKAMLSLVISPEAQYFSYNERKEVLPLYSFTHAYVVKDGGEL